MEFLLPVLIGCLGAILGSFAGVVSERLNTGESFVQGRSRCNSCSRTLTALDLIPVFSWLFSRGACRTCKARIPYLYTLTELSLGLLFFASAHIFGLTLALFVFLLALFLLCVIVLYDLRHTIVPMPLALLLVAVSAAFTLLQGYDLRTLGMVWALAGLIGLGFFLLHVCSRGRAMGLGDAPIALSLALLTGMQSISGLLFSFWIGAVIGIVILVGSPKGHRMGIEVPFVPFLAAGFLLALFTQWNPLLF